MRGSCRVRLRHRHAARSIGGFHVDTKQGRRHHRSVRFVRRHQLSGSASRCYSETAHQTDDPRPSRRPLANNRTMRRPAQGSVQGVRAHRHDNPCRWLAQHSRRFAGQFPHLDGWFGASRSGQKAGCRSVLGLIDSLVAGCDIQSEPNCHRERP